MTGRNKRHENDFWNKYFFPGVGGETKLIRMKTLLDTKKSEICQLQRALAPNHYFLNNFHLIKLTRPHSTLGYEPRVLSASFRIRINLVQKKKENLVQDWYFTLN